MSGKTIRLGRIVNPLTRRTLIVPMDHGLSMGQIEGLTMMSEAIRAVIEGGADAIVLHRGMVKHAAPLLQRRTGLIIHLSAGTSMNPDPHDRVSVCGVEEAVALGADAVSIQLNLGAPTESRMLEAAGTIVRDCGRFGIPLLCMSYPRGRHLDPSSPAVVGHCVRVAEELGADLIKTAYTGEPDSFRQIAEGCSVPVLIAGGERSGGGDAIRTIHEAIRAGAGGVCMGRNVFQREDIRAFLRDARQAVHGEGDGSRHGPLQGPTTAVTSHPLPS